MWFFDTLQVELMICGSSFVSFPSTLAAFVVILQYHQPASVTVGPTHNDPAHGRERIGGVRDDMRTVPTDLEFVP